MQASETVRCTWPLRSPRKALRFDLVEGRQQFGHAAGFKVRLRFSQE